LSAVPAIAQDTTGVGAVTGIVTGTDEKPAPHVTVCVAGITRCVLTDTAGRFRIADLRAGRYRLQVTSPGQPSRFSTEFDIHAGVETSVEFALATLSPLIQTVTVTATAQALPDEIKTSGVLVPAEAVQDSAGSLQDVSRYLQSLPGVVMGGQEERNDLIVRGGSPLENLFVVDNIEVPNINSFANFASGGGLVGVLDPSLLRDVTFLTGGYPATYSNRLSSVLQIGLLEETARNSRVLPPWASPERASCSKAQSRRVTVLGFFQRVARFSTSLQTTLAQEVCRFRITSILRDFTISRRATAFGS